MRVLFNASIYIYVGQTENLRKRVMLHVKEQIRHKEYRHQKVSEHLDCCSNGNFNIISTNAII